MVLGGRGHDRVVVVFTSTCATVFFTTKVVSSNPAHGEVYSIQHYMLKFVCDLQTVNGILWVLILR